PRQSRHRRLHRRWSAIGHRQTRRETAGRVAYREFGDVVATAHAKLSPNVVDRQAAAMDAWHHNGAGDRLRELSAPTLVATGTEDIVILPSNALALVSAIPRAWLAQFKGGGPCLHGLISRLARGSHQ